MIKKNGPTARHEYARINCLNKYSRFAAVLPVLYKRVYNASTYLNSCITNKQS